MLIEWCKKAGVPHELLEATKSQCQIIKKQGMTEEDAEKKSSKPRIKNHCNK